MIKAVELKTEYLEEARGIDIVSPRVFWKVNNAKKQKAYQIRLSVNENPWEELPKVYTDSMKGLLGRRFKSRDHVRWQVRLTDQDDITGDWSESASFELGLLDNTDWSAKWIMGNYNHEKNGKVRYPVDCFFKRFNVNEKIERARLYITACGIYETKINGRRVGDQVLTPGSTAFHKRVHYQVYDVTELLQLDNTWEIELGDGYYASNTGVFDNPKPFGYEPKVLAQLEIIMSDGSVQTVCTDSDFKWSNDGIVRFADMKNGESIDFNYNTSYNDYARETNYKGCICCSNSNPIHEKECFVNPKILHCPDGHTVLDFGQNIAGYVELRIKGEKGDHCRMVCGETLTQEGNFTVANIAWKSEYDKCHFQSVDFVCDGIEHIYKPRFSVMGFRYVLLLDWPDEIKAENFTAIAVYSDMETTFSFESSDSDLNQIVKNTFWSVKGNFLDVPTDCPTRERAGWTGDAQLFFNTGNYMMDQRAFFRKWLRDVADCQKENGLVHNINPSAPGGSALIEWVSMEGSAGWGDAMITIPYYYWKRYGDDTLMREFWEQMERCYIFFRGRMGKRNLLSLIRPKHSAYDKYLVASGRHFGEWTEPDDCAPGNSSLVLPAIEEATAYLSYSSKMMAEMAKHMEKDSTEYEDVAKKTKEAYNHYFVRNGEIETNRMCKYVRPCGLGLADGEARTKLLNKIVKLNRERGFKIGTGFLTTPFVFEMLSEAGESHDAYKTLTNPEFGWIQQVKQGATTVWENWTPDASLNHYSKGACCQWLFDCLCGVKLDGRENHFVIEPHTVTLLEYISFEYGSVYGKVSSAWKKQQNGYMYHVSIPDNCTATLQLPGQECIELSAGDYEFEV
ncbi:MAG: glycoside hydrolase family 78 protein [Lachnospiraceae bacterium]|nr:glycoside hydrolase family 78 protein [Lachnospiraceae bacterium]